MKKKNVLIVNWGTKSAIFPIRKAVELNKYNIFLATTPKIPKKINNLLQKKNLIYSNPYDSSQLIEDVCKYMQQYGLKFDIVTTFFEMNVYQAAILADYLQCKKYLPPGSALKTSVNKYLMRLHLNKFNIQQPKYKMFDKKNIEEAFIFFNNLKKPAVIKPIHSGHSYGARFVPKNISLDSFNDLLENADIDLIKKYDEWMDYENPAIDRRYVIEEYVEGTMISCDGVVSSKGNVHFFGSAEFILSSKPLLHQTGHIVPIASLNSEQINQCKSYIKNVVNRLSLEYCGFHCELIYDDRKKKPYLVEIAGRLPGGILLESYQNVTKINIVNLFFSVFENLADRKVMINKIYNKSEIVRIKMYAGNFCKLIKINFPKIKERGVLLSINSVNGGKVYMNVKDKMGIFLFSAKFQSVSLDSFQLNKIVGRFMSKVEIMIKTNYWERFKFVIIKYIKRVLKFVIAAMNHFMYLIQIILLSIILKESF